MDMATHLSKPDGNLVALGFLVPILRWVQKLSQFFMQSEALIGLWVNYLNAL